MLNSGQTFRLLVFCLTCLPALGYAEAKVSVANFADDQLSLLTEKSFVGHTDYRLVEQALEQQTSLQQSLEQQGLQQERQTVLRAEASKSASSLYRSMEVDLTQTPLLNWSWRVENVYSIENQQVKQGDDYPARVYVVVRDGWLPWQVRALNYVWSNHPTQLSHWANPFTDQAVMIPLKAGSAQLGQWHHEQVNIADDFYRVFGDRIEKIDGVAIMTDADNAGGKATAYYGNIYFSR